MKIYIELLIIVIIFSLLLAWRIWLKFTRRRLLKKYNPDDDHSKKGEEARLSAGIEATDLRAIEKISSSTRSSKPREQSLRNIPDSVQPEQDSRSKRKAGKSTRGIFAKLRRNRRRT